MLRIDPRWLVGASALVLVMVACSNGSETLPYPLRLRRILRRLRQFATHHLNGEPLRV